MSGTGGPTHVPPFPPEYRASGLLLHVTSLPSPYGIGDLGPQAFSFVDRLHDAGQGYWQSLPVGPTGYGNSPYQSLSSFAGNTLLISPEALILDGLLQARDCEPHLVSAFVDYDSIIASKRHLIERAWTRFESRRAQGPAACLRRLPLAAGKLAGRLRALSSAEGQT